MGYRERIFDNTRRENLSLDVTSIAQRLPDPEYIFSDVTWLQPEEYAKAILSPKEELVLAVTAKAVGINADPYIESAKRKLSEISGDDPENIERLAVQAEELVSRLIGVKKVIAQQL